VAIRGRAGTPGAGRCGRRGARRQAPRRPPGAAAVTAEATSSAAWPPAIASSQRFSRASVSGSSSPQWSAAARARAASLPAWCSGNPGAKSCSTMARPFAVAYADPSGLPVRVASSRPGSRPSTLVRLTVSAMPSTRTASQLLRTSLKRLPSPSRSSHSVRRPSASNTGRTRGRSARCPEARTSSSPRSAGPELPETGASTNSTRPSASSSRLRVACRPTVLIWIHTASGPSAVSAPSTPLIAAATASPSVSMVIRNSASAAAPAGVAATLAPCPASASAFRRVRFHTVTSNPARSRLRAMGAPMAPVPRTATRSLPVIVRPVGTVVGIGSTRSVITRSPGTLRRSGWPPGPPILDGGIRRR
jgi:hypothetical protein